jgi:hypothetical protein
LSEELITEEIGGFPLEDKVEEVFSLCFVVLRHLLVEKFYDLKYEFIGNVFFHGVWIFV